MVEAELRHEPGGGDGEHVAVGEARGQQEGSGRQRVLVLQRVARHLGVTEFLHFVVNKEKAPSSDVKLAVLQEVIV